MHLTHCSAQLTFSARVWPYYLFSTYVPAALQRPKERNSTICVEDVMSDSYLVYAHPLYLRYLYDRVCVKLSICSCVYKHVCVCIRGGERETRDSCRSAICALHLAWIRPRLLLLLLYSDKPLQAVDCRRLASFFPPIYMHPLHGFTDNRRERDLYYDNTCCCCCSSSDINRRRV